MELDLIRRCQAVVLPSAPKTPAGGHRPTEEGGSGVFRSPAGSGPACAALRYSCTLSWKLGSSRASAMNSSGLQTITASLQGGQHLCDHSRHVASSTHPSGYPDYGHNLQKVLQIKTEDEASPGQSYSPTMQNPSQRSRGLRARSKQLWPLRTSQLRI